MLITDKERLANFGTPYRLWQGIPGIEVTRKGRIFSTFYSGGTKEEVNNFVVLLKSEDGKEFGEPIAALYKEGYRCYDACLWIDPTGRLWWIWALAPEHAVYAVICDDPDADELCFGEPMRIGADVMMNKPTVLSTGEWLFPIAVWHKSVHTGGFDSTHDDADRRAFVYKTVDRGQSFTRLGGTDLPERCFDEHKILEMKDGRLAMFVRTYYGIGVAYSFDGGRTWTEGENSGLGGPCSRFYIGRLRSGRILLVNHYGNTGRSHLTAMLSEDEGRTWKYKLLLDGRLNVSYPDVKEAEDGYIYITYDRERGCFLDSLDKVYASAREILYAKITENDIIAGRVESAEGRLGCIISKLGKYAREHENPFREKARLADDALAQSISHMTRDELIGFIFEHFGIHCANMHMPENRELDALIDRLNMTDCNKKALALRIISLLRSVDATPTEEVPIVESVKALIGATLLDDVSVKEVAERIGISMYYMCHLFKKSTGITIVDYKKELKLRRAKTLLVHTDKRITEIAQECGFSSHSYFCKVFMESEAISPAKYREFCKK